MNALRAALPMVQAFLTMGIIISLPLILLVNTYQLKTVMTVTFALFTLHMLTFWWERRAGSTPACSTACTTKF